MSRWYVCTEVRYRAVGLELMRVLQGNVARLASVDHENSGVIIRFLDNPAKSSHL